MDKFQSNPFNCALQLCQTKITTLINKIFINKKLQINNTNELFFHTINNNKQQHKLAKNN